VKAKRIACPECEGFGKAVNYFDMPENSLENKERHKSTSKSQRSDGRSYLEDKCPRCGGEKYVIVPNE